MKRAITIAAMATVALGLAVGGTAVAISRHHTATSSLVPSGFAEKLRKNHITYSDVSAVSDRVTAAALRAAAGGSSPMVGRGQRPIVVRVTFTDDSYRDHKRRVYVDRPALMLIYPHMPVPLDGPPGSPSGSVDSTFVDFIDPDTLQYLRAISFSNSGKVVQPTG